MVHRVPVGVAVALPPRIYGCGSTTAAPTIKSVAHRVRNRNGRVTRPRWQSEQPGQNVVVGIGVTAVLDEGFGSGRGCLRPRMAALRRIESRYSSTP